ncbi:tRNA modification GTPase MnmE [Flavobacteriales bacterium]|nr:tRNA modification GTPase MnmE [Flavobacteriales bacterium]GIK69700.1 MAG: tRNA modification GTPase MnmE [Bacteroidota bacterium]CAG0967397.1 tRNA modification GTPase MnmE [Flavobacteriales bacterium]
MLFVTTFVAEIMPQLNHYQDTICAPATAQGTGAIAIIRLSGNKAHTIIEKIFRKKNLKRFTAKEVKTHTLHFGEIYSDNTLLDEVLISIFKNPHSYTGEDMIEISCHGSLYIQQQIIQLLVHNGARMAKAGEFTLRAFLNKKLDLSQAEAVADLIASDSEVSHKMAMQQMRGGFSNEINLLREQLIQFAALIELELDFSEEDVEFANREELKNLIEQLKNKIQSLAESFSLGNVFKLGVPVAIIGKPNVGKSTLLNALLNENRAIVSEIPGTTRDTIEEEITLGGIHFRFIDTAGIRHSNDRIEKIGIEKTYEKIKQASVVLYLFDTIKDTASEVEHDVSEIKNKLSDANTPLLTIGNKIDEGTGEQTTLLYSDTLSPLFISAKTGKNLSLLKEKLLSLINTNVLQSEQSIVSNTRHYEALQKSLQSIHNVQQGLNNNISSELLALDIRDALRHLGEITGAIDIDKDILGTIFSRFCIGK